MNLYRGSKPMLATFENPYQLYILIHCSHHMPGPQLSTSETRCTIESILFQLHRANTIAWQVELSCSFALQKGLLPMHPPPEHNDIHNQLSLIHHFRHLHS